MPLRDHFRPPLDDNASWEELHAGWPMVIVQRLRKLLPSGYVAGPRVQLGSFVGIDVAAFEDEYEVRIYDAKRGRHLVAAIEIVSPGNKDRPEHRNAFIAKCAALLQKGVAVSIVDLVTVRQFNLYAEVLAFIGHSDPTFGDPPPHIYATSCRWVKKENRTILEAWSHVLTLGQPLPTLPLWLTANLVIPLDLEQSYEQACHDLWIT
jgi:Protein of unknown function (DUF4058)